MHSERSSSVTMCPQELQGLHTFFDTSEVAPWDETRFELLSKVQDAARNNGHVDQMRDAISGIRVAVKTMPNDWVCDNHNDFMKMHPFETEHPWGDVGCTKFLNDTSYPYGCELLGVYRDACATHVVSELASEGDLFTWCSVISDEVPGPQREARVRPLVRQIIDSVRRLHDHSLVHRDLSLENILLSRKRPPIGVLGAGTTDDELCVQVIDFGMASTGRIFENCIRGKPSYQAPEVHLTQEYDGFLSDAFAVGVTIYALLMKDYPWLSTRPGGCKCFEYVKRHGFRAYVQKRKLRGSVGTMAQHMSPSLVDLLAGLLEVDPTNRLTLGEADWGGDAAGGGRSVLREPWLDEEDAPTS